MSDPTTDVSAKLERLRSHGFPFDLYWCPACGFMVTDRVRRDDLISSCWGACLELYGEPIPLTFVRGVGSGRPASETPF